MINLKKNLKLYVLTALLTLSLGLASFGPACAQLGPKPAGKWLAGDFHHHTTLTDGSWSMPDVFARAHQFGLDWWANSEHGGAFNRDTFNNFLDTLPGVTFLGDPADSSGTPAHKNMWRWQSLLQFSYPVLDQLRHTYPEKTIIQGFEWNVPGHEHCSMAIIDESTDPSTKLPVTQFEYLFDGNDKDTTGGKAAPFNFEDPANNGVTKNTVNNHAKAVQAVSWLQQYYPKKSWTVFAHPERKSLYKINHFRDFNNAAPDVAFGFESIPGHQKAANRGEYGNTDPTANIADGKQTYGGAGIYSAKVGGLWDALLSEGRHFWLFVNCDFHDPVNDFWLGEYSKNWTFVEDQNHDGKYSAQEIVDALRRGNSFCVLGDLINALQFTAQQQDQEATMGQTILVRGEKNFTLTIKFKSPLRNNGGNPPVVDHIDLIAGSVTGKISPTKSDGNPHPAYSQIDADAKVIARFTSLDWEVGEDGWTVIQHHLQVTKDMYFRIRGTNQSLGGGQLDPLSGDPLPDALGVNNAAAAWVNLWFYSNPIFVKAIGSNK